MPVNILWRAPAIFLLAVMLDSCAKSNEPPVVTDSNLCSDPTKLRVKIANSVFELLNTTEYENSVIYDEFLTNSKLGIIRLSEEVRAKDKTFRYECNGKAKPVADFGTYIGFIYRGDGSEPSEYRMGREMYNHVYITAFNPKSGSQSQRQYLSDVADIEGVRYVRRIDHPRNGFDPVKTASFEFSYKDRKFRLECQVGNYNSQKLGDADFISKPPYLCVPGATFRLNDVLVSVSQRSVRWDTQQLIPPQDWPKQWAFVIAKLKSYRVTP